jgi:TatD DNase family protein
VPLTIIDTHAHVYADAFDTDRPLMLQRAKEAGISKILMPGIDSSTHRPMLAVEDNNPDFCISMMGLHPCYVKDNFLHELKIVEDYFAQRSFVAVGEIGLDFYWDKTYTPQQYEAFHRQIEIALHYQIPIAIHSRNATDECIEIVKHHQKGSLKGVFHCFSGDVVQAQKIMDLNFYLGIGGVATFKNGGLDTVLNEVGLSKVILETDAPYLAPVPHRGKRNEPSYLIYIVDKIALQKNVAATEVIAITAQNANALFNL